MNLLGVWAIYEFEMARTKRTLLQSIVSPVISTSLSPITMIPRARILCIETRLNRLGRHGLYRWRL